MTPRTISKSIQKSLRSVFDALNGTRAGHRKWTQAVKTELCRIGNTKGLYTCARDVIDSQRSHGEWLWDVSWLRYRRRPPRGAQALADPALDYLNEAVLIVECEWWNYNNKKKEDRLNLGDIRDDFQKLLVGRAHVRCMIWDDNRREDDSTVVNWLYGMIREFSATGEDHFYLLARYTAGGFQFWTVETGELSEVR